MAKHRSALRSSKSMAGAILLVLGMFILYENAATSISRYSRALANDSAALGVLPAAVLAVSQAVDIDAFNHHRFLQGVSQQILMSSWPLLMVILGTILARDTFTEELSVGESKTKPVRACSRVRWN